MFLVRLKCTHTSHTCELHTCEVSLQLFPSPFSIPTSPSLEIIVDNPRRLAGFIWGLPRPELIEESALGVWRPLLFQAHCLHPGPGGQQGQTWLLGLTLRLVFYASELNISHWRRLNLFNILSAPGSQMVKGPKERCQTTCSL